MSAGPERPAEGPSAQPNDPNPLVTESSVPRHDSVRVADASSALSECIGAISLVQVTAQSLKSQDVGCAEQDVLNRVLQVLWSVHDWIHDQMWSETEAERRRDRECQS